MKHTLERIFSNLKYECLGWSYQTYDNMLKDLLYEMRDKIGHPFIGEQYRNLRFVMNIPLYHEFFISCQMAGKDSEWCRGVKIIEDTSLCVNDSQQSPYGIVRLIYEEPEVKTNHDLYGHSIQKIFFDEFFGLDRGHGFKRVPHIDHVKFNGPATIVFWKDGTKTVVKHDGKGRKDKRQAILYAFIRKIYGEGKPYHDILNEIEEAVIDDI